MVTRKIKNQRLSAAVGAKADYFSSLDAIRGAEVLVHPTRCDRDSCSGKFVEYVRHLCRITGVNEYDPAFSSWNLVRASAADKAEAIGRTLGLWEYPEQKVPKPDPSTHFGFCGEIVWANPKDKKDLKSWAKKLIEVSCAEPPAL